MYEGNTITLDLGDDQSAVLFQEIRHGTQKAVNQLTRPFLEYADGKSPKLTVQDEKTKIEGSDAVKVDMTKVDWDAVNDAIIVSQVKEWTFGPVDQATLDGIPDRMRNALKRECDRLYGESGPLPEGGGGN